MATSASATPSSNMEVLASLDLQFGDDPLLLDDQLSFPPITTPGNGTPNATGMGINMGVNMGGLGLGAPNGPPVSPATFFGGLAISTQDDTANAELTESDVGPTTDDGLVLPLNITVTPTGDAASPVRYQATGMHKRSRSNPEVLGAFSTATERPSLPANLKFDEPDMLQALPIRSVKVTTPKGFQEMLGVQGPEDEAFFAFPPQPLVSPNATLGTLNGLTPITSPGGKRKRDVGHARSNSSPGFLYQNQDQLRMYAQQAPLQPFHPGFVNSPVVTPTTILTSPVLSPSMMVPPPPPMEPSFQDALLFQNPETFDPRRSPVARPQRPGHRSGLSADMSYMNIGQVFSENASPSHAEAFNQAATTSYPPSPPLRGRKSSDSEQSRKAYRCGVCGKPKVGHVCTKPEMRYNWTQVDLDVTKGAKIMNCALICVKSKWIPQHEDNIKG